MRVQIRVESQTDQDSRDIEVRLEQPLVLGRDESSPVPLQGDAISRHHLRLEAVDGQVRVMDESSNGSWLNGERLVRGQPVFLGEADVISIPNYRLTFSLPGDEQGTSAPIVAGGDPQISRSAEPGVFWRWVRLGWESFTRLEIFTILLILLSFALAGVYLAVFGFPPVLIAM